MFSWAISMGGVYQGCVKDLFEDFLRVLSSTYAKYFKFIFEYFRNL